MVRKLALLVVLLGCSSETAPTTDAAGKDARSNSCTWTDDGGTHSEPCNDGCCTATATGVRCTPRNVSPSCD